MLDAEARVHPGWTTAGPCATLCGKPAAHDRGKHMAIIAIDPGDLRRAADDVDATAAQLGGDHGELAGSGQPGWECANQLSVTARAWVDYLDGFRADLGDLAKDLRSLADNFVAATHDVGAQWAGGRFVE